MKKIISILICILFLCSLASCDLIDTIKNKFTDSPEEQTVREKTVLDADTYKNYNTDVYLNTETYPCLARQGFTIAVGVDEEHELIEAEANKENLQKYFDPNKNLVILINGLQVNDGRRSNQHMGLTSYTRERFEHGNDALYHRNEIAYFADDDISTGYDVATVWKDNGYNVLYFHWEMFADYYGGTIADILATPLKVTYQIWSTDHGVYGAYNDGEKDYSLENAIVGGSVAEWFTSEYLHVVNSVDALYPTYKTGGKDIRFSAHSMGGMLCVAGATLVKLVAEAGQMPLSLTPNRVDLLDSYVIDKDIETIAWTGKEGESVCNYLVGLSLLVNEFDVAVSFYMNEGYTVPFLQVDGLTDLYFDDTDQEFGGTNSQIANGILELCPMILLRPYFQGVGSPMMLEGHNPVREWYFLSLLCDAPTLEKDGVVYTVPTAKMSDEEIKNNKGRYFEMVNAREQNCETVRCDDDVFILR